MTNKVDYIIIGAGIIGLSIAREILINEKGSKVLVIEKESYLGAGQSGHNSNVIHSGIYYRSGSLKSKLCLHGKQLLEEFAKKNKIPLNDCEKIIVAKNIKEIKEVERLYKTSQEVGIPTTRVDKKQIGLIDQNIKGIEGIIVHSTKTINYQEVLLALKNEIEAFGGQIQFRTSARKVEYDKVITDADCSIYANNIIIAMGLELDRIIKSKDYFTVGFTGRYLKSKKFRDSNILVYPAPNKDLPFLGVHTCHQDTLFEYYGPNAIFSLSKTPITYRNFFQNYFFKIGFYRVLIRHWQIGLKEILMTHYKKYFQKEVNKLITKEKLNLQFGFEGTRAQCISKKGELVEDFIIEKNKSLIILRNVPSPAATSCLAIAQHIYLNYLKH